ncbi:MAG TPA: NUDIX domain-containing protein [Thermomicrobiales bacterium]|jgi:8-oxo-dGTP pyrophosphatase MutT (NUDIX family)
MARGRAVIVEDGAIALIERRRHGRTYYVFPGGGAEPGESLREAARREAEEELGLRVEVGELLAEDVFEGEPNAFFAARVVGGELGTGRGAELAATDDSPSGSYRAVWIPLSQVHSLPLFPAHVAALVAARPGDGSDDRSGS